jgi:hypothetical protein
MVGRSTLTSIYYIVASKMINLFFIGYPPNSLALIKAFAK